MHRIQALFISSRPISWVNTAYPFAAMYYLATRSVSWELIIGTLYFLVPYNLLMYGINDVFDYESDVQNPRKGGIEGALLDRSIHRFTLWAAALSNLPFVLFLLSISNTPSRLWLVVLLFMVIAYSAPKLRFKERPFLDSFTSATHFVSPMIFAMLLTGWQPAYWLFVVAYYLWAMASHAFGAVQDVQADRAAGIGSVATVIGAAPTVSFAILLYALASGLLLYHTGATIAVGITGFLYILNVLPFSGIRDADAQHANDGWRRFIYLNWFTGFILTLTLIWILRHQ